MITTEEKAKAYDEALERAKTLYENANGMILKKWVEQVFPELAESEDEKVRKELIKHLKEGAEGYEPAGGSSDYQRWLAWLEKQGTPAKLSEEEQNRFAKGVLTSCALSFIDYLDAHKYEGKMCVSNGECEDIENAFHNAMWDRLHRYYCKYIEEQGEQKPQRMISAEAKEAMYDKPAWSEEDDSRYSSCLYMLEREPSLYNWLKSLKNRVQPKQEWSEEDEHRIKDTVYFLDTAKKHYASTEELDACIDWLKSLRPQNHWKPNELQLGCLSDAIEHYNSLGYPAPKLKELYEQLKKL